MTAPFRIHLMWDENFADGSQIAGKIFHWFRGDPSDLQQAARGIPISYHQIAQSRFEADDLFGDARVHLMVPLVDNHMVVSNKWRRFLERLIEYADNVANVHICPVALTHSAFNLPETVCRVNFLRTWRSVDPADWDEKQKRAITTERILRYLTQVAARILFGERQDPDVATGTDRKGFLSLPPPPKMRIFLSHAKTDGTHVADAIRQSVYSEGQIDAFFDERDLAIGYDFGSGLYSAATTVTSMIAIMSDSYSSRPWCRWELQTAVQPIPGDASHRWWKTKPAIVVDALKAGGSRLISEIGEIPVLRWQDDQDQQAVTAQHVTDRLLREAVTMAYNTERAQHIAQQSDENQLILGFIPGVQSLLDVLRPPDEVQKEYKLPNDWGTASLRRVVVPPPGISEVDKRAMTRYFPELEILSFEDFDL